MSSESESNDSSELETINEDDDYEDDKSSSSDENESDG